MGAAGDHGPHERYSALRFRGDEYLELGSVPDLGLTQEDGTGGSFTVEMWVKWDSLDDDQPLLSLQAQEEDKNLILMSRDGLILYAFYEDDLRQEDRTIEKDEWYHLAFTYNCEDHKRVLYINAEPVAEDESSGDWSPNADEVFRVGSYDGNKLEGCIDELRFFNIAREQEAIESSYKRVLNPASEPELVAYYHFDYLNMNDRTANERSTETIGSFSGEDLLPSPLNQFVTYGRKSALLFTGDQYLDIGTPADMGLTTESGDGDSFTVEFYVRFDSLEDDQCILSMEAEDEDKNLLIMAREGEMLFGFYSDDLKQGETTIEVGEWYHMAFTYDHDDQKRVMYINAQEVASDESSGQWMPNAGDPFRVGYWGGSRLRGAIDELRFFKVARSQESILSSCKSFLVPSSEPNLAAYYHFENLNLDDRTAAGRSTSAEGDFSEEDNLLMSPLNMFDSVGMESALVFTGEQRIEIGSVKELGLMLDEEMGRSFTVECWVRFDNLDDDQPILSLDAQEEDKGLIIMLREGDLMLAFYDDDLRERHGRMESRDWYHLAFTYNQEDHHRVIYVNAQVVKEDESNGDWMPDPSDVFKLGYYDGSYLQGALDQVRIFNLARSQEDIESTYRKSISAFNQPDLISYFHFEYLNLNDRSIYTRPTTVEGDFTVEDNLITSPLEAFKPVTRKSALIFAGEQSLEIGTPEDFEMIADDLGSSFTVECWVKFDNFDDDQPILSMSAEEEDKNLILMAREGELLLAFYEDDLKQDGGSMDPEEWYHVAFTYNQEDHKRVIYINAEPVAEDESNGDWAPNGDDMFNVATYNGSYLNGAIDELRIFNVARDQEIIAAGYRRALKPALALHLSAYYFFEDLYFNDRSPAARSTTVNGAFSRQENLLPSPLNEFTEE